MDANPYRALRRAAEQIARRCPAWLEDPRIVAVTGEEKASVGSVERVVQAVRCCTADRERSDRAVRALATVGRDEPDATTVLIHALAPGLWTRLDSRPDEYRAYALGELAFVVLRAVDAGHLECTDRLAQRLVNRAWARASRHHVRIAAKFTELREPGALVAVADSSRVLPAVDTAEEAVVRVGFERFAGMVRRALSDGALTTAAWQQFRDLRLAPALGMDVRTTTAAERVALMRARRAVRAFAEAQLAASVA